MNLDDIGWTPLAIAGLWAIAVAVIGGWLTDVGPWYEGLTFPSWRPPNYLFGPAWTVIFLFICASGLSTWSAAASETERQWLIGLLVLNSGLNIGWSYLFFRLRRPDLAFIEVLCLEASIVVLAVFSWRITPLGGALMLPYVGWVAFAACLNREMVRLNGPFGLVPRDRSADK